MSSFSRIKNQLIAKVITRFPNLAERFISAYKPWESGEDTPWCKVTKPLAECKVALVTTSGVHHDNQSPFNMQDSDGDPTHREIDGPSIARGYTITGRVRGGGRRPDYIRDQYELNPKDRIAITIMAVIFIGTAIAQITLGVFSLTNSPLNIYLRGILNIP